MASHKKSDNKRRYSTRRFFTNQEIRKMRDWATAGKSQAFVAKALDRDPGTIAGAAIRYDIKFNASKGGAPKRVTPEQDRQRKARNCRRYRLRQKGAILSDIKRFDDPRVTISLDTIL